MNACEKIHFLFLKKKNKLIQHTHTLLALSFFIDDNDVVVFNLSLGTSSYRMIVLSYDNLSESQCDRNFDLLQKSKPIIAQVNSEKIFDWLKH